MIKKKCFHNTYFRTINYFKTGVKTWSLLIYCLTKLISWSKVLHLEKKHFNLTKYYKLLNCCIHGRAYVLITFVAVIYKLVHSFVIEWRKHFDDGWNSIYNNDVLKRGSQCKCLSIKQCSSFMYLDFFLHLISDGRLSHLPFRKCYILYFF